MDSRKESLLNLERSHHKEEIFQSIKWAKERDPQSRILYSDAFYHKYTYYIGSAVILALVTYVALHSSFPEIVLSCLFGYIIAQTKFVFGHMATHAAFIDHRDTGYKLPPGVLIAYLHHYDSPGVMPRNYIVHRLGTFTDFAYALCFNYWAAWIIPVLLFDIYSLIPLYAFFWFWWWFEQPGHDWYHHPKTWFSPPMRCILTIFEKIGILDQTKHDIHHNHTKDSMEDACHFTDFYCPPAEWLAGFSWKFLLKQQAKGYSIHKTSYVLMGLGMVFLAALPSCIAYIFLLSLPFCP